VLALRLTAIDPALASKLSTIVRSSGSRTTLSCSHPHHGICHSLLTARPPTPRHAPTVGEDLATAQVVGCGFPSLSHHFGAAPPLRSFRLLPSSVAPLAPLRHHSLRVFAPRVLNLFERLKHAIYIVFNS
jgi:hypothetical protein